MYITWHLVYYHLTTWHAIIWPDPLVMTWLTWLLSISWYACYLIYITAYHAISWHQAWYTDSHNYHDKGNVVPDYRYVLTTVMYYCYDMTHSRTLIIMLISDKMDNLYGYGRKWWMPEWYLAYSDGIKVYIYIHIYIYNGESVMILLIIPTGSRGMELL